MQTGKIIISIFESYLFNRSRDSSKYHFLLDNACIFCFRFLRRNAGMSPVRHVARFLRNPAGMNQGKLVERFLGRSVLRFHTRNVLRFRMKCAHRWNYFYLNICSYCSLNLTIKIIKQLLGAILSIKRYSFQVFVSNWIFLWVFNWNGILGAPWEMLGWAPSEVLDWIPPEVLEWAKTKLRIC